MSEEIKDLDKQSNESNEQATTQMPGLTATMEIAGAESIPGAEPHRIVLGFSRED